MRRLSSKVFFFICTFWTPSRIQAIPPEAKEPLTDSMQDIPFFMESVVRTETLETLVLINIKTSNEEYKKKTPAWDHKGSFFLLPTSFMVLVYYFSLLFLLILLDIDFQHFFSK